MQYFDRLLGRFHPFLQATKALREGRGIALLSFRPRHQKRVRGQRHAPAAPYPRQRTDTHWVGLRAGVDRWGKSRPTGIRSPDRPARRQSLYRLSHRGPQYVVTILLFITSFQERSQNCEQRLRVSSCPIRTQQLVSHWTDLCEIQHTSIFRKSVEKIQVSLKSDKNNGYLT